MKKYLILLSVILYCGWAAAGLARAESQSGGSLTREHPILVDLKGRSVTFLAEVNGKYFSQPTRHGAVFSEGKNGDKSIFRAYAKPEEFYEGLVKIGLKPGNNMTVENKEKTFVQGDPLTVTVTWKGANRSYLIGDVITDSNGAPFQMRFGGNLQNALEAKTGCLLCLDSCPVGIGSNAAYTYGAVEKRHEVAFKGNHRLLPPDGTLVIITVKGDSIHD